jgi:GTP-binding protein
MPESTDSSTLPALDTWISQVQFLQSGAKVSDLPRAHIPEVAIAGRSNAGKSTALNVLCQRKRLAFASKTPGRTRLINLFSLIYKEQEVGRLVDLPGYGYASVDKQTQAQWQQQLARYLDTRDSLVGLILVTDIRHPLGPLDVQMLDWFARRMRPIHVLLTKADKLTRQQQQRTVSEVRAILTAQQSKWGPVSLSVFSGLKKTGRDPVLARISLWLGLSPGEQDPQKKPADQLPDKKPIEEAPAQGGEAGDETSVQ